MITAEVFLVALVPHFIWLTNNEFITITYGLARTGLEQSSFINHIQYSLIFIGKQIGILIPFFIVNGLLTGSFIIDEIVWYNNNHNLGLRIGTIPIEDIFYGFSLLFLPLYISFSPWPANCNLCQVASHQNVLNRGVRYVA